jgi:hypothetical protein
MREPGLFEIGNGALDVFPIGVLGQNRAHADFKGRIARPPMTVAETIEQGLIYVEQVDSGHNGGKYTAGLLFCPVETGPIFVRWKKQRQNYSTVLDQPDCFTSFAMTIFD